MESTSSDTLLWSPNVFLLPVPAIEPLGDVWGDLPLSCRGSSKRHHTALSSKNALNRDQFLTIMTYWTVISTKYIEWKTKFFFYVNAENYIPTFCKSTEHSPRKACSLWGIKSQRVISRARSISSSPGTFIKLRFAFQIGFWLAGATSVCWQWSSVLEAIHLI